MSFTVRRYPIFILALLLTSLGFFQKSSAHVTLEPGKATAGAYAKLTFRVPHGCEGSATTAITVQIPEGALSVKPQVHPGWKIKTKKVRLAKPATLHGKEILESISEITWTGGPLSDEHMDEFGVSLKLPDQANAELLFPVIQVCKKGTSRWVEKPTPDHSAKFPAPFLVLEASSAAHKGH